MSFAFRETCPKCRAIGYGYSKERALEALAQHGCRVMHAHYRTKAEAGAAGERMAFCEDPACWALKVDHGAQVATLRGRDGQVVFYRSTYALSLHVDRLTYVWDVWLEEP